MRRKSTYEDLAVLARNNRAWFSASWRDKILSFKTFKPLKSFKLFERSAAVELLEQFKL
jgi:hypothetical protein